MGLSVNRGMRHDTLTAVFIVLDAAVLANRMTLLQQWPLHAPHKVGEAIPVRTTRPIWVSVILRTMRCRAVAHLSRDLTIWAGHMADMAFRRRFQLRRAG